MDHFSPSYFALLGPLDQAKLFDQIMPISIVQVLNALSEAGVRRLLGGDMALTLYGIPGRSADLDLLVDTDESNIKRFIETIEDLVLLKTGLDDPADLAGAEELERIVRYRLKTYKTR